MQTTTYQVVVSGKSFAVERDTDGKFILPEEIRDLLTAGTALKPSWEPIVLARKPLWGTVAANVLAHGTGALNIDGCRVEGDESTARTCNGVGESTSYDLAASGEKRVNGGSPHGRWPANIIHDGSDEVVSCFPAQAGAGGRVRGTEPSDVTDGIYGDRARVPGAFHGDSGSAARFFYSAKADKTDRMGSGHPTVKPVDLMQWLCRLVTPPGGTILDPFAGSGTTGEAAWREGFRCILIEREEEYQADIAARLALADKGPMERKAHSVKQTASIGPLFGDNDNETGGGGSVRPAQGPTAGCPLAEQSARSA